MAVQHVLKVLLVFEDGVEKTKVLNLVHREADAAKRTAFMAKGCCQRMFQDDLIASYTVWLDDEQVA